MKATTEESNSRTLQNLLAVIAGECERIDVDARYDDMLDECYSFESVGGIFAGMSPSRVLRECDEVAYRCGKNDWLDSEREIITEVDGEYYDAREVDKARDESVSNLETEADEMEEEIADLESEDDDSNGPALATLTENLEAKREEIAFAEKYSF